MVWGSHTALLNTFNYCHILHTDEIHNECVYHLCLISQVIKQTAFDMYQHVTVIVLDNKPMIF